MVIMEKLSDIFLATGLTAEPVIGRSNNTLKTAKTAAKKTITLKTSLFTIYLIFLQEYKYFLYDML
jgi:hypothetical protein